VSAGASDVGRDGTDEPARCHDGSIDPALPIAEARQIYFERAGLPADGGYAARWVPLRIGPIPFAIPNTKARRRAVPLHDVHHLVTGYRTDWPGEGEISAWELGAGCGSYGFAWAINLHGLVAGWVCGWRRTFRAFVRGRRSRSLYRELDARRRAAPGRGDGLDEALLRTPVGALRARLLVGEAELAPRASDRLVYAGICAIALVFALASLAPVVVPIALGWHWLVGR
jgi:hypothetical protein